MTVNPDSGVESSGPSSGNVSSATPSYEQVDEPTCWTTPRNDSPHCSDQIPEQRLLSPYSDSFARHHFALPVVDETLIDRPRLAPSRLLEVIQEEVSPLASSPTDDRST